MAVLRVSFTNLAEATAALGYGSGQASNYCATEAQQPQRPFKPWRTVTTTTTQEWLLDLGSSQTLAIIGLINAGFTSATIQGASSSGLFAAPGYSEVVTLARNPVTWRYQHAHLTTGFGYRWVRIKLDATTSTGSTGPTVGSTYYSLGGVWAGALTSAPSHLLWGLRFRSVLPALDVAPGHRGWSQRLQIGQPRAQIEGTLSASLSATTPGLGDDFATWSDLIRQMWDADYIYAYTNLGDPAQGYVVRWRDDPEWLLEARRAQTPVVFEELVGP